MSSSIPDPGIKKKQRIPDPDPQHWLWPDHALTLMLIQAWRMTIKHKERRRKSSEARIQPQSGRQLNSGTWTIAITSSHHFRAACWITGSLSAVETVSWIRNQIRMDRHNLPDPDLYPFKANVKINESGSGRIGIICRIRSYAFISTMCKDKRIRIRSDRHHFAGTWSMCSFPPNVKINKIRIRSNRNQFAGPGSVPYSFQPDVKINYTFSRKFQYAVQNTENYETYDTDEKDKTM